MSSQQDRICRLCGKTVVLCNSHIIPEFFYTRMYDTKHRFFIINNDPDRDELLIQKGVREKLLCRDCEKKFSKLEGYVRNLFYGKSKLSVYKDGEYLRIQNLDCAKFKLFLLSMLWRMGVARLKWFNEVALGPHEEKIRCQLLNSQPGEPDQYPCVVIATMLNGRFSGNWILPPQKVRVLSYHCYRVVVGGFLFVFWVSSHKPPSALMEVVPKTSGEFAIRLEEIRAIGFLADAWQQIGRAIRAREGDAEPQ